MAHLVCFQATKCPRMMVDTTEVACVYPAAEHVGGHVGSVVPTAQPTSFEELCANVDRVVAVNGFPPSSSRS